MLSSGQLCEHEEREPTLTLAMPEKGVSEVKYMSRRACVIRLLPNGFQERKLRRLANISAGLFNEINHERRQGFFHGEKVGFEETWGKYYEKYKAVLGVKAQAVMQKKDQGGTPLSLLKLKKEGEGYHPLRSARAHPDTGSKRRPGGGKSPRVMRQENHAVDEQIASRT